MKDELISFETAKLAKEKGFHERVIYYYIDSTKCVDRIAPGAHSHLHVSNKKEGYHSAPTQSLLQRWLRDVHNLHLEPKLANQESKKSYYYGVYKWEKYRAYIKGTSKRFNTYEQALEEGLQEALKLV